MKRKVILFLWLLVIAIAVMIFLFSAQDGAASSRTSGFFTNWLIHLLYPDYDAWPDADQAAMFTRVHGIVRKGAHFTEFAMLGGALRLLFAAIRLPMPFLWAWAAGTLYACTDELHQKFVGYRDATLGDVCIDSAGVLTMVCLVSLILLIRRKRKAGGTA